MRIGELTTRLDATEFRLQNVMAESATGGVGFKIIQLSVVGNAVMTNEKFQWPESVDELYGNMADLKLEKIFLQPYAKNDAISDIRI